MALKLISGVLACGWIKPHGVWFIGLTRMDGLRLWQIDSRARRAKKG